MSRPQVIKVFRQRSLPSDGNRTLQYCTAGGSRRSRTKFFDLDQVPDFLGESAWFEVEPARKGPWMSLRFLRQVDDDGRPIPEEPEPDEGAQGNFRPLLIIYDGRPHLGAWVQDDDQVHVQGEYGEGTARANRDPKASAQLLLRRLIDAHYAAKRARGEYAHLVFNSPPTGNLPPAADRA
jgi:hypothetical protein